MADEPGVVEAEVLGEHVTARIHVQDQEVDVGSVGRCVDVRGDGEWSGGRDGPGHDPREGYTGQYQRRGQHHHGEETLVRKTGSQEQEQPGQGYRDYRQPHELTDQGSGQFAGSGEKGPVEQPQQDGRREAQRTVDPPGDQPHEPHHQKCGCSGDEDGEQESARLERFVVQSQGRCGGQQAERQRPRRETQRAAPSTGRTLERRGFSHQPSSVPRGPSRGGSLGADRRALGGHHRWRLPAASSTRALEPAGQTC